MAPYKTSFELGEPVWARMDGFPWWPGRIVCFEEVVLDPDVARPHVGQKEELVEFFNDKKRFAPIEHKCLRPFCLPKYSHINEREHGAATYERALSIARKEAVEYCLDSKGKWRSPFAEKGKPGRKPRPKSLPKDTKTPSRKRDKPSDDDYSDGDLSEEPRESSPPSNKPRKASSDDEDDSDEKPPKPKKRRLSKPGSSQNRRISRRDSPGDGKRASGGMSPSPTRRPRSRSSSDALPSVKRRPAPLARAKRPKPGHSSDEYDDQPAVEHQNSPTREGDRNSSRGAEHLHSREESHRDKGHDHARGSKDGYGRGRKAGRHEAIDDGKPRDAEKRGSSKERAMRKHRKRPESGSADEGGDALDESAVVRKMSQRKGERARQRESTERQIDAHDMVDDAGISKSREKRENESQVGKDEHVRNEHPGNSNHRKGVGRDRERMDNDGALLISAKRKKREKTVRQPNDEPTPGRTGKVSSRNKEGRPKKKRKTDRTHAAEVEALPEAGPYANLTRDQLVSIIAARDSEIRSYRVQLFQYRLENMKTMGEDEVVKARDSFRAACDKLMQKCTSFADSCDLEEEQTEKSEQWKKEEREVLKAISDVQMKQFDTAWLKASKNPAKLLHSTKSSMGHSAKVTRALRDLLVQWVDVLGIEHISEEEPSQKLEEHKMREEQDVTRREVKHEVKESAKSASATDENANEQAGSIAKAESQAVSSPAKPASDVSPAKESPEARLEKNQEAVADNIPASKEAAKGKTSSVPKPVPEKSEKSEARSGGPKSKEERAKRFTPEMACKTIMDVITKGVEKSAKWTEAELNTVCTAIAKAMRPAKKEDAVQYYTDGRRFVSYIRKALKEPDIREGIIKELAACVQDCDKVEAFVKKSMAAAWDMLAARNAKES